MNVCYGPKMPWMELGSESEIGPNKCTKKFIAEYRKEHFCRHTLIARNFCSSPPSLTSSSLKGRMSRKNCLGAPD